MRGSQAALSPVFGAPAMPWAWQAAQMVLYVASPGLLAVATAAGAAAAASAALAAVLATVTASPLVFSLPTGATRAATSASLRVVSLKPE